MRWRKVARGKDKGAVISQEETEDGILKVPSQVDGHHVVGINNLTFFGDRKFTELVIPEGVTEI